MNNIKLIIKNIQHIFVPPLLYMKVCFHLPMQWNVS